MKATFSNNGLKSFSACRAVGLLMIVSAAALLTGCVSMPTAEQVAQADCGPKPTEQETEKSIRDWCIANLKDPESARYEFLPLKKGHYIRYLGDKPSFAWEKGVLINAKNSYGGYTGAKPYSFFFGSPPKPLTRVC